MSKLVFKDIGLPFVLQKCGIGLGTAALIGGIASGVGATAAGLSSAAASNNAVSTNKEENEKNRQFNSEEAEKARQWQSEQWQNQFDQQTEEWYKQVGFANEEAQNYWIQQQQYNSPLAQVNRLQDAGLNPAAAISNQTFGGTGLSAAPVSVPSPSVTSAPSASVGLSNPAAQTDSATAFGSVAQGLASIIKSVSAFGKDSAEVSEITTLLEGKFKKLMNDIDMQELSKSLMTVDLYVKQHSKDAQVQQYNHNLQKTLSEIAVNWENASYFGEKSVSERLNQVVLDMAGKVKFEEWLQAKALTDRIAEIVDNRVNLGKEQIKTEQAKQQELSASAYEKTEAAKLHVEQQDFTKMETDLTSLKKVFQTLQNGIEANNFRSSVLGLERQEADQLFHLIETADKLEDIRNDWNLWNSVRRVKNLLGFQMNVGANVSVNGK